MDRATRAKVRLRIWIGLGLDKSKFKDMARAG